MESSFPSSFARTDAVQAAAVEGAETAIGTLYIAPIDTSRRTSINNTIIARHKQFDDRRIYMYLFWTEAI